MNRREFVSLTGGLISSAVSTAALATAQRAPQSNADFTIRISEIEHELAPGHKVRTLAYNGQIPGPLLRMTLGKKISVDIVNDTRDPEMVHWHGFGIPPEVDGAHEEGTPMVQGKDRRRYTFTPQPVGTRWYHAHAMAGTNLNRGTYSGQFGMVIIEPRENPARYDLEVPILLHEWDGYFSTDMMNDVEYKTFSINGRMLGSGEPIQVKRGQRVLFRVLNSSATANHRLALPGHTFTVVALDGNDIAKPVSVPVLEMAPGERIDAIVEMKTPGIWILGEEDDRMRIAGAGIVVEYADATGGPQWKKPGSPFRWSSSPATTGISGPSTANHIRRPIRSSCAPACAIASCSITAAICRTRFTCIAIFSSSLAGQASRPRASSKMLCWCRSAVLWKSI
jgi:FtsP/CotA-like multicopper oxidase with cupredoxin domain